VCWIFLLVNQVDAQDIFNNAGEYLGMRPVPVVLGLNNDQITNGVLQVRIEAERMLNEKYDIFINVLENSEP
jgi:hypothetical protein